MGVLGLSNSIVTGLLPVTLSLFFRESPTAVEVFSNNHTSLIHFSLLLFTYYSSGKAQLRYEYLEMVIILIILPYLFTFHFSLFTIYSQHLFTFAKKRL